MGKSSVSIGYFLLNLAVAVYLFATGILDLGGRKHFWSGGGEISDAVGSVFRGDIANLLTIVLAVLAIVAGVLVLLKLLGIVVPVAELLLVILAIAWLVFIVLHDIIYHLAKPDLIAWLRTFSAHLMGLGGILLATKQFGVR